MNDELKLVFQNAKIMLFDVNLQDHFTIFTVKSLIQLYFLKKVKKEGNFKKLDLVLFLCR